MLPSALEQYDIYTVHVILHCTTEIYGADVNSKLYLQARVIRVFTRKALSGGQARVKQGDPMAAEYLLDVLGDKPVLALPTQRRAPQRPAITPLSEATDRVGPVSRAKSETDRSVTRLARRRQGAAREKGKDGALPGEMRRRLASVLIREFSKKVPHCGSHR